MKRLVLGILAHVDSGKTTLSEGMLFASGAIRRQGRVDHKDAFLDTHHLERDRGITIFSKQAVIALNETEITLLDTPGHVDFSLEAERTLRVLDYAVLVVSGSEGVQSHTETLWNLLSKYNIPTFIFVNKMDLSQKSEQELIDELKAKFSSGVCHMMGDFYEDAAMCSEELMAAFLEKNTLSYEDIQIGILKRKIFPCYFGSALKMTGIEEFLEGICSYSCDLYKNKEFGAKIFKVGEDEKGVRLSYMKICGGELKVRESVGYGRDNITEKITGIRIYSGEKYKMVEEALPGMVCAVTGLSKTTPGMGLGSEKDSKALITEPVLTYCIDLPQGTDVHDFLRKLKSLEEEEPEFHILWSEQLQEIHIQIMGEIQLEILKELIKERFSVEVEFSKGSIVYKETIKSPIEGVGHYEPLRHYAEVHLLLEPGKPGSGLRFHTKCSEDKLDRNWQRLILTHLEEKTHPGVLTGSPITDMKITLIAGKAHLKHTEGGDFREATYRAIRQGLMMAESILLEPWYDFLIELPQELVGRAMTDINNMGGKFESPEVNGEFSVIRGSAPVEGMRDYAGEVRAYTKGRGRVACQLKGYEPCQNAGEVIERIGYDSERDVENTGDSVFCSHGAGFLVKWNEVRDYMHIDTGFGKEEAEPVYEKYEKLAVDDDELMRIFEKTYGAVRKERHEAIIRKRNTANSIKPQKARPIPKGPEYLLVDGYNIIFAWEELKAIAKDELMAARERLIDILCEYSRVKGSELILVFDAYKVKNNPGAVEKINNISVVYTKEAETADMYIEKVTHQLGRHNRVRVATSDNLEQLIILGNGALRVSAEQFLKEVNDAKKEIRDFIEKGR